MLVRGQCHAFPHDLHVLLRHRPRSISREALSRLAISPSHSYGCPMRKALVTLLMFASLGFLFPAAVGAGEATGIRGVVLDATCYGPCRYPPPPLSPYTGPGLTVVVRHLPDNQACRQASSHGWVLRTQGCAGAVPPQGTGWPRTLVLERRGEEGQGPCRADCARSPSGGEHLRRLRQRGDPGTARPRRRRQPHLEVTAIRALLEIAEESGEPRTSAFDGLDELLPGGGAERTRADPGGAKAGNVCGPAPAARRRP